MEISLFLALASALTWGAGDFFGGLATRESKAVGTTFVSQAVGLTKQGFLSHQSLNLLAVRIQIQGIELERHDVHH